MSSDQATLQSSSSSSSQQQQQQPTERVTAASYGALDTKDANEECWLIRIPQSLTTLLENVPEGTDVGELIFTKGGQQKQKLRNQIIKPTLTVHIDEDVILKYGGSNNNNTTAPGVASMPQQQQQQQQLKPPAASALGGSSAVVPKNYTLQAMTKKVPTMHPFVRNPNTGSVKLLGQVSRTANLQVDLSRKNNVDNINNYRTMLKDRLVSTSITNSRYVKPVDSTESVINKQQTKANASMIPGADGNKKGFGNAVYQFGKRMQEANQEANQNNSSYHGSNKNKKIKTAQFTTEQPMKSVVFELFQQQQYWTVRDLKNAASAGGATQASTKKGEQEIREILREIAKNHRSGDHKNMWELRKEFQNV